jgi:hypothetical protein
VKGSTSERPMSSSIKKKGNILMDNISNVAKTKKENKFDMEKEKNKVEMSRIEDQNSVYLLNLQQMSE